MRDNAARLSGCLLLHWRAWLQCTPVVYAEGDALHARPRRRPSWRKLLRLRWRPYNPGQMDVLFPATAAAAITIAAAAAAAAAAVATLAALATLATLAAALTAHATLAAALAALAAGAATIATDHSL